MTLCYLPNGRQKYEDRADFYARFILDRQLLNDETWSRFIEVFRSREDAGDHGWRGEYFGKMMRGACLTYRYCPNDRLYALLERTVRDLLATADENGRIATYPPDHEFVGWDVWCRKYVLVGCLHFYGICKDEALRAEILAAMDRHLTYIESKIGDGKTPITDTSEWYGGMNASSILEAVVELYKLTKEPRHLAFAEHILRLGGCKGGNVLDVIAEGKLLPHEFPTTKAYETMSYIEGVLAYHEVTGKSEYLDLAEKFCDLVAENEITVIGCAGCHGEHFDHAVETQTRKYPKKYIMQETCVTVTWIRLSERLLRVTGRAKYADRIERSALNALYGAINLYGETQYGKEEKTWLKGLPFDSYSPLVSARRGIGIGGYKKFAAGGYYGCCACIGAAGTALYPLASAMASENGLTISFYHAGEISYQTPQGVNVGITVAGDLADGKITLTLHPEKECVFDLTLRIPDWSGFADISLNGESNSVEAGYHTLSRVWKKGDALTLSFNSPLIVQERDGRVALSYGPFVLARDQAKESLFAPRAIAVREDLDYRKLPTQEVERVRLEITTGGRRFLFTDYASCGKHWTRRRSRVTVWQKKI